MCVCRSALMVGTSEIDCRSRFRIEKRVRESICLRSCVDTTSGPSLNPGLEAVFRPIFLYIIPKQLKVCCHFSDMDWNE